MDLWDMNLGYLLDLALYYWRAWGSIPIGVIIVLAYKLLALIAPPD